VVGKTVPGVHAEVIDDNNMPLPPGEVGRLRVKSRGLVQGYIGAPEISARVFRDGWFYGADLAELTPGGELIHHGRADDMLIFDGVNIYPAEIEAVLLKHPRIAEAAAFSLPSDHHGDSPAAAIVSASPLSEQELFDYCRPRLGSRAPKRFLLVHALPKNAAGKISRIALRELAEPSKPDIAGELT
jgi:acyl-coenzyme A synthetase/AMP-(fatty) acid ligase